MSILFIVIASFFLFGTSMIVFDVVSMPISKFVNYSFGYKKPFEGILLKPGYSITLFFLEFCAFSSGAVLFFALANTTYTASWPAWITVLSAVLFVLSIILLFAYRKRRREQKKKSDSSTHETVK